MNLKKRLHSYLGMFGEAVLSTTGRSYFHYTPKLSKNYVPGEIGPYFFDFSGKTKWPYRCDKNGIPVSKYGNYSPMIILQKALGHYNNLLDSGNHREKEKFLVLSRWLASRINDDGSLPIWGKAYWNTLDQKYSAMAQGLAASVLIRAYLITKQGKYESSATKSIKFLTSGKKHHLIKEYDNHFTLEEYPGSQFHQSVLNGWIFAIFGIYEIYLISSNRAQKKLLKNSLDSISALIKKYDLGYWSLYDLSGSIASVFYHKVHIVLLEALSITFSRRRTFYQYHIKFRKYLANPLFIVVAFFIKCWQKIIRPTEYLE